MQVRPRPLLHMLTRPLMKFCPSQLMQLLGLWRQHRGRAPPLGQLESPRLGQMMQLLARPLLQLLSRPLMQLCRSRLIAISIFLANASPFLGIPSSTYVPVG